jgi:hypothetical protein
MATITFLCDFFLSTIGIQDVHMEFIGLGQSKSTDGQLSGKLADGLNGLKRIVLFDLWLPNLSRRE